MIVDSTYDEGTLLALGAWRIAEVRDEGGNHIGYDVSPDFDLSQYAAVFATQTKTKLLAYTNAKVDSILQTANSYTADGATIKIDASQGTRTDLGDLVTWGTSNSTSSQPWVDNFGIVTNVTGTQFVALAPLVGVYALSVYAALAAVIQAITAGTITTEAQIDSYAWPTNN